MHMGESLKKRLELARKIVDHPAVRVALLLWAIIAAYDTFSSQILPDTLAKKAPKVREVIVMTSGWLPFWAWLLLLAAILVFASLEFALRRTARVGAVANGKLSHRKVSATGITWGFDNPNHYFLGLTGAHDSIVVPAFQGFGHNNLGVPIEKVSGYLRIDRNNKRYPMYLVIKGALVNPQETHGIPIGADFTVSVPFYVSNRYEEYIPALQFLADFPPFTFVFEYDGRRFERTFTREDVKSEIFKLSDVIAEQNKVSVTRIELMPNQPASSHFKSEIVKRIGLIDQYYALLTGPAWDAYCTAFQHLCIEWAYIITAKGSNQYIAEIKEFNANVASVLNKMAALQRDHGYYDDISQRIGGGFPFQAKLFPAIARLLEAVSSLPSPPSRQTCSLIEPQQKAFNDGVNEFHTWIDATKKLLTAMRQEELSRPTKD
jgi:hypothetical protein